MRPHTSKVCLILGSAVLGLAVVWLRQTSDLRHLRRTEQFLAGPRDALHEAEELQRLSRWAAVRDIPLTVRFVDRNTRRSLRISDAKTFARPSGRVVAQLTFELGPARGGTYQVVFVPVDIQNAAILLRDE